MHGSHASALGRVITCLLLALALIPAPAEARRAKERDPKARIASVPREFFGINASGVWAQPPERRAQLLASFKEHGLSVVRMDISWSAIEPVPPLANGVRAFRWDRVDQAVAELAAAGLRVYPLLAYSTAWSGVTPGDLMSRPADPALFAGWAEAVARRYGRGGSFWAERPELPPMPWEAYEVWNEPNATRFWREQATAPEDYADLYAVTHAALKSVDPAARVVTGGLVDRGAERFLERMLDHRPDLRSKVDAVSYHPYLYSPREMVRRIRDIRRTLVAAGAGQATVELSETGWSTTEISDEIRGRRLAELSERVLDPRLRVTRLIPYGALTIEHDPGHWEHWFGLYNADGSAKPSMLAFAAAIRSVESVAQASRSAERAKKARKAKRAKKAREAKRRAKRRAAKRRARAAASAPAR